MGFKSIEKSITLSDALFQNKIKNLFEELFIVRIKESLQDIISLKLINLNILLVSVGNKLQLNKILK